VFSDFPDCSNTGTALSFISNGAATPCPRFRRRTRRRALPSIVHSHLPYVRDYDTNNHVSCNKQTATPLPNGLARTVQKPTFASYVAVTFNGLCIWQRDAGKMLQILLAKDRGGQNVLTVDKQITGCNLDHLDPEMQYCILSARLAVNERSTWYVTVLNGAHVSLCWTEHRVCHCVLQKQGWSSRVRFQLEGLEKWTNFAIFVNCKQCN